MFVKPCLLAGLYFYMGFFMAEAQFYFLSDQYYLDFPDDKLMKNKVMVDGSLHKCPCFFSFRDRKIPEIYWIVPISSRYEKYKQNEQRKNMGVATLLVSIIFFLNIAFPPSLSLCYPLFPAYLIPLKLAFLQNQSA